MAPTFNCTPADSQPAATLLMHPKLLGASIRTAAAWCLQLPSTCGSSGMVSINSGCTCPRFPDLWPANRFLHVPPNNGCSKVPGWAPVMARLMQVVPCHMAGRAMRQIVPPAAGVESASAALKPSTPASANLLLPVLHAYDASSPNQPGLLQ
jgi:hypothetical protein